MAEELISLLNDNDEVIGFGKKLEVHQKAILHRAFSIQVICPEKGLLLQRRAFSKYHSPGVLSNTCCSHLPKGFTMDEIVHVRLKEEMGFDCDLHFVDRFRYKADFNNGLTENEIDHVYIGVWCGVPEINKDEVAEYVWLQAQELENILKTIPENFSAWFPMVFEKIKNLI